VSYLGRGETGNHSPKVFKELANVFLPQNQFPKTEKQIAHNSAIFAESMAHFSWTGFGPLDDPDRHLCIK
jgi:hypothetical protein